MCYLMSELSWDRAFDMYSYCKTLCDRTDTCFSYQYQYFFSNINPVRVVVA